MSGDTFTRDRFAWLEALTADGRLHSTAIRVAVVISSHLNRVRGEAWPSLKTIAEMSATPERTVKHAIAKLCEAGYLEKRRGGFSKSNIYAMAGIALEDEKNEQMNSGAMDCPTETASGAMDCPTETASGAMDCPTETASGAMGCPSVGQWVAPHSGNGLPPNPLIEPSDKEPIDSDISPPSPSCAKPAKGKGREEDARFEEFYRAYPKKASKGTARKAWARAVKLANAETIIAGAMRYAAERTGQDSTYTKHPATWLNAEAWNDEPPPVQQPVPFSPAHDRRNMSAKERTGAAIRAMLASIPEEDLQ